MEKKPIILCDTNIIIEFYKNNDLVIRNLQEIGQQNIAISIVTVGELLFGVLNKHELEKIKNDIAHLNVIYQNRAIGQRFAELMEQYSLSHRISVPDGLIAATSLVENVSLYTYNLQDFKFIKGIDLYKEIK